MMRDNKSTKPSNTALAVIDGFIRGARNEYQGLFSDNDIVVAEHIRNLAIRANPSWLQYGAFTLFTSLNYTLQSKTLNYLIGLNYDRHMAGRKLLIRNKIEDAIASGTRQIIFLGSGFDPRAYLAAKLFPSVQFFELDRGRTREIKLQALRSIEQPGSNGMNVSASGKVLDNLCCLDCDFEKDNLKDLLNGYHYDIAAKTLVIAEGLTSYLTNNSLRSLLGSIASLINQNSEFLLSFTYVTKPQGAIEAGLMNAAQEYIVFDMPPDQVIKFCNENSYHVTQKMLHDDMHGKMSTEIDAQPSENKANIKQENYFLLACASQPQLNAIAEIPTMKQLDQAASLLRMENSSPECSMM